MATYKVSINVSPSNNFVFTGSKPGDLIIANQTSNTGIHFGANSNLLMSLRSSNTVITTTRMDIQGDLNITGNLLQNGTAFVSGSTSGWSNSSNAVVITGSNVGIGKTNPATALDVVGNITVSGDVIPASNAVTSLGRSNLRIKEAWIDKISASNPLTVSATSTNITGDVTIGGNVTISGSNFIANVQTVEVQDNIMLLNKGDTGNGVTAGTAGLDIYRGTASNNYRIIFQESSQTLLVGLSNALQTAATREWANTTFMPSNVGYSTSNRAFSCLPLSGGNMTGAIYQNPNDNAAAPSYSWSNDTNTGMYHAIQTQIGFSAGGSNIVAMTPTALNVFGSVTATGDVSAYSDMRIKTDLQPITSALDKIKALSGYTYTRKDIPDPKRHAGLIAQDVQSVLPEVVNQNSDGYLSVAYGNMLALVIEGIKELDAKLQAIESAL